MTYTSTDFPYTVSTEELKTERDVNLSLVIFWSTQPPLVPKLKPTQLILRVKSTTSPLQIIRRPIRKKTTIGDLCNMILIQSVL